MLLWGIFMVLVQMWEQDEEGTSEEDPGVLEEGVSLGMALTGTEDELEVAVGGLGLVTGQDEEDAAAESADGYQDECFRARYDDYGGRSYASRNDGDLGNEKQKPSKHDLLKSGKLRDSRNMGGSYTGGDQDPGGGRGRGGYGEARRWGPSQWPWA